MEWTELSAEQGGSFKLSTVKWKHSAHVETSYLWYLEAFEVESSLYYTQKGIYIYLQ